MVSSRFACVGLFLVCSNSLGLPLVCSNSLVLWVSSVQVSSVGPAPVLLQER